METIISLFKMKISFAMSAYKMEETQETLFQISHRRIRQCKLAMENGQ